MSKILLVCPSFEENTTPNHSSLEWVRRENAKSHYPMGIAFLHAYMQREGHEIRTLFLNTNTQAYCLAKVDETIAEFKPDVVGINMLTQNRTCGYRLIERINKEHPSIRLVAGGIHATACAEQLVGTYPYLTVVSGEGELTFAELIKTFERGGALDHTLGIVHNKGGKVVVNGRRPLIEDLDSLPMMAHELFMSEERTHACIMTSRGCPMNCSFCALESIGQRKWRKRSVGNVIGEIAALLKTYPHLNTIWIHDDTFFLDNARVIEFCNEVVKKGWHTRINFIASGRIKPVSKEMVDSLQKANFVKLMFGLESGDDGILNRCHKGITREDVRRTMRLFAGTNIECICFLIVGLPGETWDTLKGTAKFIQEVQRIKYLFYDEFAILMIYPGTEVFRLAKEAGIIDDAFWLTDEPVKFYTVEHSLDELKAMKRHLRDTISLGMTRTWSGFSKQWYMAPYIVRYFWDSRDLLADKLERKLKK